MKAIGAFFAITGLFVAIQLLGAGILFGSFKLGLWLVPELMERAWFTYPLALAGVAATIWLACVIYRRLVRGPARGRA